MTGPIEEGLPYPLGAHWSGKGTKLLRCSRPTPPRSRSACSTGIARPRIELPEYTDQVFHGYIPDVGPGTFYGYRVHGPYDPARGHRFNTRTSCCSIPMRARIAGSLTWSPAIFGYQMESGDDLTFDERGQRALRAEMRGRRSRLRVDCRNRAADRALGRDHHLRQPMSRDLPGSIPTSRKTCAAPLCRIRLRSGDRASEIVGSDLGRAAAGPHLHQ